MAAAGASELGLFGVGRQGETQLAAAAAVLPLKRAFVYSRSEQRRTAFAEKMGARIVARSRTCRSPAGSC